jgi:hypothetical protein
LAEAEAAGGDCTWPFRPDAATSEHGSLTTASNGGIALGLSDQTLPRCPTVYPPPLPTQLGNAFRTIARISRQLLRTHLRQRFGQQMASRAFVITRRPAYLHTELCAPAQARGHADCELPFRHCTPCPHHHMRAVPSLMPIASCHFVIAWALGNPQTAREQVATHYQPRNLGIALPSLTSASLVVGTAGVDSQTGTSPLRR